MRALRAAAALLCLHLGSRGSKDDGQLPLLGVRTNVPLSTSGGGGIG